MACLFAGCASQEFTGEAFRRGVGQRESAAAAPDAPTAVVVDEPAHAALESTEWGEGAARSYVVPAVDILGFQVLLNLWDREFEPGDDYDTDASTIADNLSSGWVIDTDPFAVNQFLHPYQGALYHGFARSAGLGYWESLAYDFVGSAVWEVAGETTPPSLNDQITTSFGGSFLGEALFRTANALLASDGAHPGFGTELGAALISPSTGWNRLAFGDRFDGVYPGHGAAAFARLGVGLRHSGSASETASVDQFPHDDAIVEVVMDYGLPGKAGYEYTRPFDYFHFEFAATSSENSLPENVMVQGLLSGRTYQSGQALRGVWGAYGTYDYISPEVFSVSSTALAFGTSCQLRCSEAVAVQSTCLAGLGWAAAGTIADAEEDRSYHYGACPQGLAAFRVIGGSLAMLDLTGRLYYLDGTGSNDRQGNEVILRARAALVVRVYGHHALTVQYVASSRDANYDDDNLADTSQSIGSLSLLWTYCGSTDFGVVE